MPSKRPQFVTGGYYHIFNRGVEKRNIFLQIADYFRFIFCLYELNDKKLIRMRDRIDERKQKKHRGATPAISSSREPLVEVMVFCLMPNHYHLVLRQLVDNGISLFMKKLADSYVGYFNLKHDRRGMGSLFQGRFKAVHIKDDDQLANLIGYIFTNPVELIEKNWKAGKVENPSETIKFLESYKWSSYLDSIGTPNFPSVTERRFIAEFFGSPEKIKEFTNDRITSRQKFKNELDAIEDIILE